MGVTPDQKPLIVWLDPGQTTGAAVYDLQSQRFSCAQYAPDHLIRGLGKTGAGALDRMEIGWEMYLALGGPHRGTSKHSQEAIGRIKDFALAYNVTILKSQPSSARRLGSPALLRRLGWYAPGKPHANDAARHLLADLLRRKLLPGELRSKLFPDQ